MAGDVGKVGTPPSHYATESGLQPFEVIDAYGFGFFDGNAFKYLVRGDKKGDPIGDLRKALHYIEETILRFEQGRIVVPRTIWGAPAYPSVTGVIVSFGLDGHIVAAVENLLYWRFSVTPLSDLQQAGRYVERAIAEAEHSEH